MRPVEGSFRKTAGLVVQGDRIEWRGWVFGLPQVHESLITRYDRPAFFQDAMARGRFKRFQHDHRFTEIDGHTLVVDKVKFSLPLWWPGKVVARWVMVPHIAALLRRRMLLLKHVAESTEWQRYLPEEYIVVILYTLPHASVATSECAAAPRYAEPSPIA